MEEITNPVNDKKATDKAEESVIIYRSWFICLWLLGPVRFAKAMFALLSYAFFSKPISSFGLPKQVETILDTFTPIIDKNC